MKNEKQLLILSSSVPAFTIIILSILLLISTISDIFFKSIFFGIVLSVFNFVLGMMFIIYSINKSEKIFLITLWAGLIFRLVLMLSVIVFMLIFLEINKGGFIFSVFIFYIFYLIIEILYLNLRKIERINSKQ